MPCVDIHGEQMLPHCQFTCAENHRKYALFFPASQPNSSLLKLLPSFQSRPISSGNTDTRRSSTEGANKGGQLWKKDNCGRQRCKKGGVVVILEAALQHIL